MQTSYSFNRLKTIALLFSLTFFSPDEIYSESVQHNPEQVMWFTHPAKDWKTQAIHIGNGYMGASFYGGVKTESFDIAEKTFWTGGPNVTPGYNYGIVPGGKDYIAEIRKLIADGEIAKADAMARSHFMGNYEGYGFFSKVGMLYLDFAVDTTNVADYERGLDLSRSLGFVNYKAGNVAYHREYFCSYPDKMLVVKVSADQQRKVSFNLRTDWVYPADKPEVVNKNEWLVKGLIDESGLRYCVRIRLVNKGGELVCSSSEMGVKNADEAMVCYTVETEYKNEPPTYKGNNPEANTAQTFKKTRGLSYGDLRERHIQDYKALYDRVSFHLAGDRELAALPTDERVGQLKSGMTDDSQLKVLWFNLGRYSVISASRPGTLPSTLQGVWNHFKSAAWSGNFQSNINLQEMYWSCGPTDLPECQQAYIDWVRSIVPSGKKTAKAYYGTEGWVSHATGNIWGYTSPGVDLMWGIYPMGSAWHCQHLWSQYLYTSDTDYLKNTAYPIMREAAQFYLANLVKGKEGLYWAPGVTAEHGLEMESDKVATKYSTLNGEINTKKIYLVPCYQDIEMIYDLFSNVIDADKVLKSDRDFVAKVEKARDELVPLKIGKYGQLQEWLADVDNPRDHHRHIAHLFALYPGQMITATQTPELFDAARVSLNMRGNGAYNDRWPHTGGNWSAAWRMACFARLFDGEKAIHIFNQMIRQSGFENMMSSQSGNFQVDAMMATPALFSEMLMQSHDGCLNLLPALPMEWPEGEINNLVARGGYRISLKWDYGQLTKVVIEVPQGKSVPLLKLKSKELPMNDERVQIVKK